MAESHSSQGEYLLNVDGKYYNTLDISGFSQMMKDPAYCYKFYWLEAIVNIISEDKQDTTFGEIIDEMICNAWYSVREFHIHLSGLQADGFVRDGLERAVLKLTEISSLSSNASKVEIKNAIHMQIFVDADACPVVGIVEKIAKGYKVPVTLLCDTNHVLSSSYSEVIVVGAGADAVDYKLISICQKGDIVVSQDYGVAAMALGKGAFAIHQSGKWYTDDNIDQMLMERHLNKKARRASSKNHIKGPRKRTTEDDERFRESFEKLLRRALEY